MAYKTSVQIEMDASGAIRNLGLLGGQMQRTERQSVQSLGAIRSAAAGAAGTLATLGAGLGIANSISTIQRFDQSLAKLRAISGATATDMKQLSAQARELGATTVYGANQAAEAQTFLAQAGLKVNDVLGATPQVLQFAQAGMLDLGQAADLATDLMAQMSLGIGDLGRIGDVLVKTANSATTTVADLGQAFSYAGPVASNFGLSLEETAAALGQISSAGVKAGRAGTGLLGVLRQLGNVTPQNEALLKQYGLTIADVDVAANGFQTVIDRLADANLSAADAFQIFGSEAASAGLALTRNANAYKALTRNLGDASGAMQDQARIMSSDLASGFKSLQSALDEYVLQLGDDGATGGMKEFVTTAAGVVNVLNDMGPQFVEAGGYSDDFANRINAIAQPIITVQDQWKEFTESFGSDIARSRNMISRMEASIYDAQASIYSLGASGIEAFSSLSKGVRNTIETGLNKLIESLNYIDQSFANLLDNVGSFLGPLGANMRQSAADIRAGLIDPVELGNDALEQSAKGLRDQASASREAAKAAREIDYEEQRKQLNGMGDELSIIRSYNERFVSSLGEAMAPIDEYIARMAGGGTGGKSSVAGSTKEADKAAKQLDRTLDSAMGTYGKIAAAMNPAGAAMDKYRGQMAELELLLNNGLISQLEFTAAVGGAAAEYNKTIASLDDYNKSLELQRQLQNQLNTSAQGNALQVAGVGMGDQELQRAQQVLQIQQQYQQKQAELLRQYNSGDITQQQYDEQYAIIEDFSMRAVAQQQSMYEQMDIARGDWMNGFTSAWENFSAEASNAAGSIQQTMGGALNDLTNSFVNFVETGKLSFSDLTRNMLDGFIRTIVQMGIQSAAQAALTAASWAPAAAATSIATFGGAAAAGMAALSGVASQALGVFQFADGGYVSGPGSSTSDSIPARLSNGEYVVNARATSQNRALLEAINSGRKYATGGYVSSGLSSSSSGSSAPISAGVNVVVNNMNGSNVQAEKRRGTNGREELYITVADIQQRTAKARILEDAYLLKRRGD